MRIFDRTGARDGRVFVGAGEIAVWPGVWRPLDGYYYKIKVYNTGRIIDLNQKALHKHMATFLVKKIQEHIPCLLNSPGHKQEHWHELNQYCFKS
jgi:hypothetical protein